MKNVRSSSGKGFALLGLCVMAASSISRANKLPAAVNNTPVNTPFLLPDTGKVSPNIKLYNDPTLNRLTAEVNKHADAITRLFNSKDFQAYPDENSKEVKEFEQYYKSAPVQKQADQQAAKYGSLKIYQTNKTAEEKINQQMAALSRGIDRYFENAEYKRLNEELIRESNKLSAVKVNSAAYKVHLTRITSLRKSVTGYTNSPDLKKLRAQMSALSLQIARQNSSPRYVRQKEAVDQLHDSLSVVYNEQYAKKHTQEAKAFTARMNGFEKSDELKKERILLNRASQALDAYLNSPAYKKRLKNHQ